MFTLLAVHEPGFPDIETHESISIHTTSTRPFGLNGNVLTKTSVGSATLLALMGL